MRNMNAVVITPTRDRGETFLPNALQSVQNQKLDIGDDIHIDYTHIVVNDGSQDITGELLNDAHDQDARIYPIHVEESRGAGTALYLAREAIWQWVTDAQEEDCNSARPDFIVTLDDDDELAPDAIVTYAQAFAENPLLAMVFGNLGFIDTFGNETANETGIDYNNFRYAYGNRFYDLLRKANEIPGKPAIRGDIFLLTRGSELDLRDPITNSAQDWVLSVQAMQVACMLGRTHRHIDRTLEYYRLHPDQHSLAYRKEGAWKAVGEWIEANIPTYEGWKKARQGVGELLTGAFLKDLEDSSDDQDKIARIFMATAIAVSLGVSVDREFEIVQAYERTRDDWAKDLASYAAEK